MFLRHSLIYLFGRGIPGIIGFATIVVYTHLLSPGAYGQYALVISTAILVNSLVYQWLNASLLRFLPQYRDNQADLLTALLGGFIFVSVLSALGGLAFVVLLRGAPEWDRLILFSIVLIWVQAWFTINLELARSRLAPVRYGVMSSLRTGIALGLGALLVLMGFGVDGALLGLITGYVIPGLWGSRGQWKQVKWRRLDSKLIKKVLAYGLPLTASYSLNAVIFSTDRFMLAGMMDESATGLYVAGQGLPQQAVGVFMMMVNLAAYPIVVSALEEKGAEAARAQLRKNLILLLGVGLPVTSGFIFLAPDIAGVFLGEEFQDAATLLIPWIALAAFLGGLRAYYYDLAFYLGRRTSVQVVVMLVAALVNAILNLWLIPVHGLVGAAYASVAAHGVGLAFSAALGRQVFRLPALDADVIKLMFATLAMTAVLYFLPPWEGMPGLILAVAAAGFTFVLCTFAVDAGGIRETSSRVPRALGYKSFLSR